EIGAVIGASRSAIIAKMHRLGFPKNGVTTRPLIKSALAAREAERAAARQEAARIADEQETQRLMESARIERERLEEEARLREEAQRAEAEKIEAAQRVEAATADAIKAKLAETFDTVLNPPKPIPVNPVEMIRPDGGVRFLDARERMCRYPLWGNRDNMPIHKKFVCGATTVSPTCSWCTEHLVVVADPIRKSRYANSAKV
ncbi:MAG: hypothetical protein EOP83_27340, partial [Verrucomicrobiaceae bacterium]